MFTQKYRPKNFSEVIGSKFAVKILKSICKNPDNSPRSLILSGNPGSGKTSCSRIFPLALNCKKFRNTSCNLDCLNCPCQEKSVTYEEFNCSYFGNVKNMRGIKDYILRSFNLEGSYRVLVFDEIHLASPEGQSALLSDIEECDKDIFFIFCTTDPSGIIPTITSRSIEIEFSGASLEEIVVFLRDISSKECISFSDMLYERIAYRSCGDIRYALNRLQEAVIVGEAEFLKKYTLLEKEISDLFNFCISNEFNISEYNEKVTHILKNPVQYIRDDFEKFIVDKSVDIFVEKKQCSGKVELLISDWLKIQRNLVTRGDWNVFFNTMQRYSEKR